MGGRPSLNLLYLNGWPNLLSLVCSPARCRITVSSDIYSVTVLTGRQTVSQIFLFCADQINGPVLARESDTLSARMIQRCDSILIKYLLTLIVLDVLVNEYLPGQGIMPHKDGSAYHPGKAYTYSYWSSIPTGSQEPGNCPRSRQKDKETINKRNQNSIWSRSLALGSHIHSIQVILLISRQ